MRKNGDKIRVFFTLKLRIIVNFMYDRTLASFETKKLFKRQSMIYYNISVFYPPKVNFNFFFNRPFFDVLAKIRICQLLLGLVFHSMGLYCGGRIPVFPTLERFQPYRPKRRREFYQPNFLESPYKVVLRPKKKFY